MTIDALILFLRSPEPGTVKTRIAAVMGDDFALGLYHAFLKDLAALSHRVRALTVTVCTGPRAAPLEAFSDGPCFVQRGKDIGERMMNAFRDVFSLGFEQAVLMGSDLPDLPAGHVQAAFEKLAEAHVVLGPATDGGYYLIGCRRESLRPSLFSGISWSTASVCADTLGRIREAGLQPALIEPWPDIDTVEDLKRFYLRHRAEALPCHTMDYLRIREATDGLRL